MGRLIELALTCINYNDTLQYFCGSVPNHKKVAVGCTLRELRRPIPTYITAGGSNFSCQKFFFDRCEDVVVFNQQPIAGCKFGEFAPFR
jgi:hypothetical protein